MFIWLNPNGGNIQKFVPKVVSKFHDDPTINESVNVVLLDRFWWMQEKERVLEKKEGKMNLSWRGKVDTYCKCKNWPNMSLFIARVL